MKNKLKYLILIILTLFFGLVDAAHAQKSCGCITPEVKAAFHNSSLVLIGRVTKVVPSIYKKGFDEISINPTAIFKGDEEIRQRSIIIYTKQKVEECGAELIPGFDYIIYASGLPAFFTTTSCSRNTLLDSGYEEIQKLKEIIKK